MHSYATIFYIKCLLTLSIKLRLMPATSKNMLQAETLFSRLILNNLSVSGQKFIYFEFTYFAGNIIEYFLLELQ